MKRIIVFSLVLALLMTSASAARITLSAAGDVILGGKPDKIFALGQSSEDYFAELIGKFGFGYPFEYVQSYFKNDDVSIVNLECALTNSKKGRNKGHVFRGKPDYAKILSLAGIEVADLANNHTLDFFPGGLKDTRASLNKAGVRWCDFYENGVYVVKKDGLSVKMGFAGFQTPTSAKAMQKRIRILKSKCDVVVASFHWCDTTQWVARNFASDRKMSRLAINAGADLVLGHHRHLPAGIDSYKGKYIAYDLGNFVAGFKHLADKTGRPLTDAIIFQWTFDIDEKKRITNQSIRVIPCTTSTTTQVYPRTDNMGTAGAPVNNFRPGVLTGDKAVDLLDRVRRLSSVEF